DSAETQRVLRAGGLLVPRLRRQTRAAPAGPSACGDGAVLITGGTSGLGAETARHIVGTHGVRRVLLVSRRGAAPAGVGELVDELTRSGAQVRVEA
ncbi:KR domain-containing protein, partial [Nocardia cyriacigeorgica]|uniref:KR domain-containing protein n=1 Tax=Nocardia cyriacigeorgica TaxID=135487 RepID=UPI0018936F09